MKKKPSRKLSLNRETLRGLDDLNREGLNFAGGEATQLTCFQTCYCRSAYTCYWSECGCQSAVC